MAGNKQNKVEKIFREARKNQVKFLFSHFVVVIHKTFWATTKKCVNKNLTCISEVIYSERRAYLIA